MEIEIMTALFSAATFVCVWLFSKPQRVEIEAMKEKWEDDSRTMHESYEKNTRAIEALTRELQESREDRVAINEKIKTLFAQQKSTQAELESLRSEIMRWRHDNVK